MHLVEAILMKMQHKELSFLLGLILVDCFQMQHLPISLLSLSYLSKGRTDSEHWKWFH